MNVLELFAKLSLDTSEYDEGLEEAKESSSNFSSLASGVAKGTAAIGTSLLAVGSAAVGTGKALFDAASGVAESGDEIDKMSQKVGLSTEAYQEWDYVLNLAGTEMSSMSTGLKTLTNKLDDAKNGSADAEAMFASLGMSLDDLNNMSREDIFEATIFGFQQMEDSTERAALANDLFGKSGQELTPLFNQTTEATLEQIEAAHEYGMVMSDEAVKSSAAFEDSLTKFTGTVDGIKNSLTSEFLPSITTVMDGLSDLAAGKDGGADKMVEGFRAAIDKLVELIPRVVEIFKQIFPAIVEILPDVLDAFMEEVLPAVIEILPDLLVGIINFLVDALPELIPQLIDCAVQLVLAIVEALPEILVALTDAFPIIVASIINGLIEALPDLIVGLVDLVILIVENLPEIISNLIDAIPDIIISVVEAIIKCAPKFVEAGKELLQSLEDAFSKIVEVGENIVNGLWDGIKNSWSKVKDGVSNLASGLVDSVKNLFGIHSPSKVFEEIGGYITAGFNEGLKDFPSAEDLVGDVNKAMNDINTIGLDVSAVKKDDLNVNNNVIVTLSGDAASIFKVVQKENDRYIKANGVGAFA